MITFFVLRDRVTNLLYYAMCHYMMWTLRQVCGWFMFFISWRKCLFSILLRCICLWILVSFVSLTFLPSLLLSCSLVNIGLSIFVVFSKYRRIFLAAWLPMHTVIAIIIRIYLFLLSFWFGICCIPIQLRFAVNKIQLTFSLFPYPTDPSTP